MEVPKCPFCGAELNRLVVYELVCTKHAYKVHSNGQWEWQYDDEKGREYTVFCPECYEEIPIHNCIDEVEDFLDEKYIILRSDDPEIKRKGDLALFKGKVYKVVEESNNGLLYLELVEDKCVADIIGAGLD